MRTDVPTILANTSSVGDHVCTWVLTSKAGYTVRTKAYNKVVSNFEAGEIREPIGGHLADYVDCPNEHLRRSLHSDVQARGCTRIEVSLYACRGGVLSANTAKEVVAEALALVSPSDLPEEQGLFVVQLPAKQRENLANEEGVELGPLRSYTKDADAGTILAANKRPTQLHPNGPYPGTLLPPSASVSWVWKANKCHAIGIETSTFRLEEAPEIAQDRAISTLSTRNREKLLQQIRDSANAEDWRRRAWARL